MQRDPAHVRPADRRRFLRAAGSFALAASPLAGARRRARHRRRRDVRERPAAARDLSAEAADDPRAHAAAASRDAVRLLRRRSDHGERRVLRPLPPRQHSALGRSRDLSAGGRRRRVDTAVAVARRAEGRRAAPVEVVAVNQCSGNSRGFSSPRVFGAQLANGSMGNARWTGVPLSAVLAKAGVAASARAGRVRRSRPAGAAEHARLPQDARDRSRDERRAAARVGDERRRTCRC